MNSIWASHVGAMGPNTTWATLFCLPKRMSWELDQKLGLDLGSCVLTLGQHGPLWHLLAVMSHADWHDQEAL